MVREPGVYFTILTSGAFRKAAGLATGHATRLYSRRDGGSGRKRLPPLPIPEKPVHGIGFSNPNREN